MLYDPKWEKKADERSLQSLIAWLERQPAEQEYDYCDSRNCLIAQWLKAAGVKKYAMDAEEVARMFGGRGEDVALGMGRGDEKWTFGAALERARASLTSSE